MENKVLIKLFFPELEKNYDIYIPVNEIMWKIKVLIVKCISDLSNITINSKEFVMINNTTGQIYGNNDIVINTDIRNGTEIILISAK